jgi:hypothetical protein
MVVLELNEKWVFSLQEGITFLNLPKTHWVLEEIITSLHSFLPSHGLFLCKEFFLGANFI